jgi:ribose 5-phosphate isomerase RpiB
MKIYIGSDHAGYNLKEHLVPYIQGLGFEVVDAGAKQYDIGDDYPTDKSCYSVSHDEDSSRNSNQLSKSTRSHGT